MEDTLREYQGLVTIRLKAARRGTWLLGGLLVLVLLSTLAIQTISLLTEIDISNTGWVVVLVMGAVGFAEQRAEYRGLRRQRELIEVLLRAAGDENGR